jgi:UDP-N-acetylmuramate: L-alanyl-gamma-D-glutamyl-meso-diaminopimelate ligase
MSKILIINALLYSQFIIHHCLSHNTMQKIHFIAIGGAAMHNLAIVLHKKGFQVTGSDDEIYEPSRSLLATHGLLPETIGWFPEKITSDLSAVILGMHARADNPELLKAQELGLQVYSYPEFIYEQSRNKQRVVIAGSHGKTTITSMILHVLKYHNRKFDYMVGARIDGFNTMAGLSDAPLIVIEGDEYLASPINRESKFLFYHPHIVLMSGIAWDHINVFPVFDDYVHQFERLADMIPKAGTFVYDKTDERLAEIADKPRADVAQLGYEAHPHLVRNGRTYLLASRGREIEIEVFGLHNMKNLNGAKLILEKIGIDSEQFYEAIVSFRGAAKRLEKLGENTETVIYRDFAHAPSKVAATTVAVQEQFPERRLIACVELHTFSSLNKTFLNEYRDNLASPDIAVVFYSPQTIAHKRLEPISEEDVKKAFNRADLQVFTDRESFESFLKNQSWKATNLLLMSSGTFGGMNFEELANSLL